MSGSNEESAQYLGAEGTIDYFSADASNTASYAYTEQGISRRTLSLVASTSNNRVQYFQNDASVANGAGEVRLDFANGDYILFRRADTFRATSDIRYLVPVEHGFASGYKQWFDYPDTGEYPSLVRDSFGRQITIRWQDANVNSSVIYKVITQLGLPDRTSMIYTYSEPPVPAGTSPSDAQFYAGNPTDRLISATHRNASGATLWAHSFLYDDTRFAYALTGIVDQNGQRLSAKTYSNAGLTASEQLAGGFQSYSIDYLQDSATNPQTFVRNVTGPLGQVQTYSFTHSGGAVRHAADAHAGEPDGQRDGARGIAKLQLHQYQRLRLHDVRQPGSARQVNRDDGRYDLPQADGDDGSVRHERCANDEHDLADAV